MCALLDDIRHDDGAQLFIVKGGTAMQLRFGRRTLSLQTQHAASTCFPRIGLLAADVTSFLLDPTYRSMLDDEELALSEALFKAAALIRNGRGPVAEVLACSLAARSALSTRALHVALAPIDRSCQR